MTNKHTPGPWEMAKQHGGKRDGAGRKPIYPAGTTFARPYLPNDIMPQVMELLEAWKKEKKIQN